MTCSYSFSFLIIFLQNPTGTPNPLSSPVLIYSTFLYYLPSTSLKFLHITAQWKMLLFLIHLCVVTSSFLLTTPNPSNDHPPHIGQIIQTIPNITQNYTIVPQHLPPAKPWKNPWTTYLCYIQKFPFTPLLARGHAWKECPWQPALTQSVLFKNI